MADRPLDGATPRYPNFATANVTDPVSGEANVQTPSPEVQASGWRRLERPPRYWLNWLHRLYNQWIQWFDQEVESFRTVISVTIPNQISGLDGRIDTLETEVNTNIPADFSAVDGRLDTLETEVNTNIPADISGLDGRLDTAETTLGRYPLPFATHHGSFDAEFSGLGSANVSAHFHYVIHSTIDSGPQNVSLWIEGISGTASGSIATFRTGAAALPSTITPESGVVIQVPILVLNNGNTVPGLLYIDGTDGRLTVKVLDSGVFTSDFALTGNKGFATDIFVEYTLGV